MEKLLAFALSLLFFYVFYSENVTRGTSAITRTGLLCGGSSQTHGQKESPSQGVWVCFILIETKKRIFCFFSMCRNVAISDIINQSV